MKKKILALLMLLLLMAPMTACDGEPDDSGCSSSDGTGCGPQGGI